jgi:hypothetical protein
VLTVIQAADGVADHEQAGALAVIERLEVPPAATALTEVGDSP